MVRASEAEARAEEFNQRVQSLQTRIIDAERADTDSASAKAMLERMQETQRADALI